MTDQLLDDLDAYVAALPDEAEAPTMDDDLANRMLRRLRRQERARSDVVATAKAERDRIDAWERDRLATIDDDVAGIARMLEGYMRAVHARRKLKTLNLPNGELKLRAPRTKTEITDEAAALAWLRQRSAERAKDRLPDGSCGGVLDYLTWATEALAAEPLLRLTLEPAKGEIGKAIEAGPVKGSHEDLEHLVAVLVGEGEVVPGVVIERPTRDTFAYKTAGAASADEMGHDVDEPTQQEDR